jgi:N-acetylglucosaminyldiphosphoundecaprenol N-acetyl-beta-D-mannosaminyltransferase
MTRSKVHIFGVRLDALSISDAVDIIRGWLKEEGRCRYVVTPNVDHVVKLQNNSALVAAYKDASLVLADGNPVVWAASLLGKSLPGTVPGSDLVPALFDAEKHEEKLQVFLLGAAPGVALRAAGRIHERWPSVEVCGTYSPPMGFEKDEAECERILQMISQARPRLLIIGLGAPKQEIWVHRHRERIDALAALCVGATIDFLAGEKARAPLWMRKARLEWVHRMLSEPRRLSGRYLRCAWIFPQLVIAEVLNRKSSHAHPNELSA